MGGDGPLCLICPGASFGSSKHWRCDRWAELADRLAFERGADVVITGGSAEADMARHIQSLATSRPISLAGMPGGLRTLKAVVKLADLMVTVDSGSRHVAVALGKPVVVLMGPTHPGYTRTAFERGDLVRVEVECGPCQAKRCTTDHRCMELITVERVLDPCVRVLSG